MLTSSLRIWFILFAILWLDSIKCVAQTSTAATRYETARKAILEHPAFKRGDISWSFRDLETGQELDAFQSNKLLIPASTVKLFTTGIALQKLGNFYQFETKIMVDGEIKKHQLKGNLIVQGSGDPSFGSGLGGALPGDSVLFSILKVLQDSGITKIKGDLIIDPFILPYNETVTPRNYIWEDIGNYYGASAWGLNWRNNEFTIQFTPGITNSDSTKATITSRWATYLTLKNSIKNAYNYSREIYVFSGPFSQSVLVEGETLANSASFSERASLPDPPLAFGKELKAYLEANDIQIEGELKFESKRGAIWKIIYSPQLVELIKETNFTSNNLFAEALAKRIAFNQIGQSANPTGDYLTKELNAYKANADSALQLVDGSGLSRNNQICTAFQTQFLRNQTKSSITAPYFIGSIPKVGEEGTMKNFPRVENMRAKSGSMNKVRAYAGYFYDKNNHQIAFSIIANNAPISASKQKELMIELLASAAENKFELPFPYASISTYIDTLNALPEIINLKKELALEPSLFFTSDEIFNDKLKFTFAGEPSIEQPYFKAIARGGGSVREVKYEYRIHAQTRFAERWNPNKNEWEMICWGDVFMQK